MRQDKYKVYLIREISTSLIKYVGLTRRTLIERFYDHIQSRKLLKYEYNIELVAEDLNVEQAAELEKMLIKQYDLIKNGWNRSPGTINGCSNYHSEEQKLKWSEERKNKPVKPEHAIKNKIARLGKKNSKEHQEKIVKAISKSVMCLETGKIYKSARQAAKELNLNYSKISLVCNGLRKTTGNLHFIFVKNDRDKQK